jgi:hypothetical protein
MSKESSSFAADVDIVALDLYEEQDYDKPIPADEWDTSYESVAKRLVALYKQRCPGREPSVRFGFGASYWPNPNNFPGDPLEAFAETGQRNRKPGPYSWAKFDRIAAMGEITWLKIEGTLPCQLSKEDTERVAALLKANWKDDAEGAYKWLGSSNEFLRGRPIELLASDMLRVVRVIDHLRNGAENQSS